MPARRPSLDLVLSWGALALLALHFALLAGKLAGFTPLSRRAGEAVLGAGLACLGGWLLRDRRAPLVTRLTGAAVLALGAWSLVTAAARALR